MDPGLVMVARFGFGGRNVADRLEQSPVVEPAHPFEGGELHGLEAPPWAAAVDHLGLEQADHRFGQRVVVAVADTAHGGLDTGHGEARGVANAHVLGPAVGMADVTAAGRRAALVQRLLQGIEHEIGSG